MNKLYRQIIKTGPRPSTPPPAGYTEILCDVDNNGKLTVMRSDGSVNVLDIIPGAVFSAIISDWSVSGDLFYADITHGLGTDNIIINTFTPSDGKNVIMEDLERLDDNTLRVWSASNDESIKVVIMQPGSVAGVAVGDLTKHINTATSHVSFQAALDNSIFTEANAHSTVRSNKDTNGLFTTIEWRDSNNQTRIKSELSGGVSPNYTTRTVTYYTNAGIAYFTKSFTQSYDIDGDWTGEIGVS